MKTTLITIGEIDKAAEALCPAAKILRAGGLVAFPTETVYGLGANGLDGAAAMKIYSAKGRPSDNPLILHIADEAMLAQLTQAVSEAARQLMRAFWPGPMTLILRRQSVVPDQVTGGLDTVGIRMPDHPVARALIQMAGVPLAAPSANTSGRPSPTTAAAVLADLDGKIDAVVDGGACNYGVESTIIDCTEAVPIVLRPGAVTMEMLRDTIGVVLLDPALAGETGVPKAPGMKYTHYAPKAPLILLEGNAQRMADALLAEIGKAEAAGKCPGVIVSEETATLLPRHVETAVYGRRGDAAQIAANLYEALRGFDHSRVDVIFAEGTTERGIGLAVMNRLHKACGYRIIRV